VRYDAQSDSLAGKELLVLPGVCKVRDDRGHFGPRLAELVGCQEKLKHVLVNGVVGRLDDEDALPFDLLVEGELRLAVREDLEFCGEHGEAEFLRQRTPQLFGGRAYQD
jgi:hypothetical protein